MPNCIYNLNSDNNKRFKKRYSVTHKKCYWTNQEPYNIYNILLQEVL